jgi:hypothetical protein
MLSLRKSPKSSDNRRGWFPSIWPCCAARGCWVLNRRLYQVPAAYVADAGKRHLDFGHCLLRLPDANGQPTM